MSRIFILLFFVGIFYTSSYALKCYVCNYSNPEGKTNIFQYRRLCDDEVKEPKTCELDELCVNRTVNYKFKGDHGVFVAVEKFCGLKFKYLNTSGYTMGCHPDTTSRKGEAVQNQKICLCDDTDGCNDWGKDGPPKNGNSVMSAGILFLFSFSVITFSATFISA